MKTTVSGYREKNISHTTPNSPGSLCSSGLLGNEVGSWGDDQSASRSNVGHRVTKAPTNVKRQLLVVPLAWSVRQGSQPKHSLIIINLLRMSLSLTDLPDQTVYSITVATGSGMRLHRLSHRLQPLNVVSKLCEFMIRLAIS